jgi:hypothetical protein
VERRCRGGSGLGLIASKSMPWSKPDRGVHDDDELARSQFVGLQACETAVDIEPSGDGVRPSRWTASRGCFDRLLGMLLLELHAGADSSSAAHGQA